MLRIGHGFDAHRFEAGRPLMLGGVHVPYSMGMAGHSDGDVVIHAICDAFLGAAALGEIGKLFPDTDPAYKNIDSRLLLKHVIGLIHQQGFWIANIDATIIAEQPRLSGYLMPMRETLAADMQIAVSQLSIKVKSAEKMGAIGRGEGIAAHVVVLIQSM